MRLLHEQKNETTTRAEYRVLEEQRNEIIARAEELE